MKNTVSAPELEAEIVLLKQQATLFTAQSMGNDTYTKDLRLVTDRLHAAVRVRSEAGLRGNRGRTGVMDFSRTQF